MTDDTKPQAREQPSRIPRSSAWMYWSASGIQKAKLRKALSAQQARLLERMPTSDCQAGSSLFTAWMYA
jgi:hypothetical protein